LLGAIGSTEASVSLPARVGEVVPSQGNQACPGRLDDFPDSPASGSGVSGSLAPFIEVDLTRLGPTMPVTDFRILAHLNTRKSAENSPFYCYFHYYSELVMT
jgi:hypothetical protein